MSRSICLSVLFALACSGCLALDDFSKFKADKNFGKDAGGKQDAGEVDAGQDAAVPDPCEGVDCSAMDGACVKGACKAGKCMTVPANDAKTCDDGKCTMGAKCSKGVCKGTPKDCSGKDGACLQGVCNPTDGKCVAKMEADGTACQDPNPCVVDETCTKGVCKGAPRDCTYLDDDCAQGECNPNTGACENQFLNGNACADHNTCLTGDTCDGSGNCVDGSVMAANNTPCDDKKDCTGPDVCTTGSCAGTPLPIDTACDDGYECTGDGKCDGSGSCSTYGDNLPNGTRCSKDCYTNHTCKNGYCDPAQAGSERFPTCEYNQCGTTCPISYYGDGYCDCGCNFIDLNTNKPIPDADCSDCSMFMCERSWCDSKGAAVDNCDDSLKGDGKCDCGCQFVDPDCNGGKCCAATGTPGCGNKTIQGCLQDRDQNGGFDDCVNKEWTADCADQARQHGCMVCP